MWPVRWAWEVPRRCLPAEASERDGPEIAHPFCDLAPVGTTCGLGDRSFFFVEFLFIHFGSLLNFIRTKEGTQALKEQTCFHEIVDENKLVSDTV